ncbi:MAG: hypothetical protein LBG11_11570 [Bifidobacteriaceae bacterium]|jgi:hypothetical protein|nr:hypothetical protein [Bifidobacteriaceae bacterium]
MTRAAPRADAELIAWSRRTQLQVLADFGQYVHLRTPVPMPSTEPHGIVAGQRGGEVMGRLAGICGRLAR